MAVNTRDIQAVLSEYVEDLNTAARTRDFPSVVQKWFVPNGRLTFHNEAHGRDEVRQVWMHLVPTGPQGAGRPGGPQAPGGGGAPREVLQFPYKVENNRVYSWRSLEGGGLPKPLYNYQESQFDDKALITELVIRSAQEKPEVETDPKAARSRLARIFLAFADVFNDFFQTGDVTIFDEWLSDDFSMIVHNDFTGMGIVQHYARISPESTITLGEWEEKGDGNVRASVNLDFKGSRTSWLSDFVLTPEGKIQELHLVPAED
jgi:hypothetical protein